MHRQSVVPHRIVKRLQIWTARGHSIAPLLPIHLSETTESSFSRTCLVKWCEIQSCWNQMFSLSIGSEVFRKSEVTEHFYITFSSHSNFEKITTDHLTRAYESPNINNRTTHGFLKVEVVNNILFNIKHFDCLLLKMSLIGCFHFFQFSILNCN